MPDGAVPDGIVFVAAISGIAVIALMIGYMPTLYAAYNRRETWSPCWRRYRDAAVGA